eukprot:TRINITY_DN6634_c1_g1_i1.p2 TRINITY_DN6634_c1_g1~~TRINITY_DN6634_c1_g1_i1.p2  ORF type:complete len:160 (+),score=29.26 TRINITY_DN6634_c1_g1_i1:24-482(+)
MTTDVAGRIYVMHSIWTPGLVGGYSSMISVMYKAPPTAPTTPTVGSVTATRLLITWGVTCPISTIQAFDVYLSTNPGNVTFEKIATVVNATSYYITRLSPSTTYNIRLTATNVFGSSPQTSTLTYATSSASTTPIMPIEITADISRDTRVVT